MEKVKRRYGGILLFLKGYIFKGLHEIVTFVPVVASKYCKSYDRNGLERVGSS